MNRGGEGSTGFRYTMSDYGYLMACANRMDAFVEALRRAVDSTSVVVDLGAETGIFGLLACRFGARRVFAIDPSDAIAVAEEIAAANGYGDRFVCIQALSTAVELPEPADVIVSDLRGMVPLFESHIPTIIDARRRFLASGGILIPRRDRVWAALINAPGVYEALVQPWSERYLGLDMSAGRRFVINDNRTRAFGPEHLASEPQRWTDLDYRIIESPDVEQELSWEIEGSVTTHGLALWFESELADSVEYQTGPHHADDFHRCFWLAFEQPLALTTGDRIAVRLSAQLVGGRYVWRWRTRVASGHGGTTTTFDQSDALAVPRGSETLRRGRADHTPELDLDGQIDRFILEKMNGATSLDEIARSLTERFPQIGDQAAALARVAELSLRYSK